MMNAATRKALAMFSALLLMAAIPCSVVAAPAPDQLEFFETKIRPIFADHCYRCHSAQAEKLKGGLRLDVPDAILKGGDSGAVIVAGNPDASLLIKAVRYLDPDLQMPPKNKKLPAEQIASLEAWIKMGAPLPLASTNGPRPLTDISEARARHWAFQPVIKPALPSVKRSRWVQTPVDAFVLAALEKKHLKPATSADRRTLIRRVTYDLIGIPPTFEEVEAFLHDKRPDAYAQVVERLLASPHYGERWGRYWLDVARYADTKGYLAGGEERRFPFSYTYRDYVVRAFNEDKPYDQFLIEQIAGDLLGSEDHHALAALGFLTLGRRFLNNQNDIIDDRIDVVSRGTLGLTVTCARCHDHKFDPISTKDYYALHGVFASSEEPAERPLLGATPDSPEYKDYLKQKAGIENEISALKDREVAQFLDELRHRVGDYLLGAHDAPSADDSLKFETFAGERTLNPAALRRWISELETRRKTADPIFAPWFALVQESGGVRPSPGTAGSDASGSIESLEASGGSSPARGTAPGDGRAPLNPLVAKAFAAQSTNSLKAAADLYNKLFKDVDTEWQTALTSAAKDKKPAPAALPNADAEALRQVLYAQSAAVNIPKGDAETLLAGKLNVDIAPIRNRIEALSWTHPGAPPRAMALLDRATPANSHVLIRGNPGTPGDEVPRRFLEVLSPQPLTNGSGRLELARAIVNPNNPLTARVYVNRIWQHHFGEGLVPTAGDFGVRTQEPVHRPLLDYLAASFVENGWSTKHLHRLILLSATYQQSCDADTTTLKADPDNKLLSRMNRQRLDFEALRDTLLALAGKLDLNLGGLPVDLQAEPFSHRRSVYGLIDRQNLPGLFRTFDFANPDASNQGRFHTTVPQQALFLMNSPFVIEQTRSLARRAETKQGAPMDEQIQALYRFALQRSARRDEVAAIQRFIGKQSSSPNASLAPLEKLAQILLLSNEIMFVD